VNLFRNFSIAARLYVTFLLVALFPVVIFLYVQLADVMVSDATAIFVGLLALLNGLITSILVTGSLRTPIDKIASALQAFQTKKSAGAITDNSTDELGEIANELNRVFSTWNQEIISLGKKQFQQEKQVEQNEIHIGMAEKQLDQTRSLLKVAQTLNTTFDFQSNLKAILDEAITALNVQWASILLINREKHEMTVACVRGVEKSLLDDLTDEEYPSIRLKPHEGLAGQVIKDGLPLIANKGFKDPRFKMFSEFRSKDEKVASLLCAPILGNDGNVLGVMNFINRISPPVFRNEDLPYTHDLCTLAALIIERHRLYHNLFQDDLTGLTAHNVWKGFLVEEATRALRYAQLLSLVIVEVDGFKKLVDSSNSDFGIEIINACGEIVTRALRDTDTASSTQERFFMLLPNTDVAGAVFLAGRVKENIEKAEFTFDGKKHSVTVSAGIACYPETLQDPKTLMKSAITALAQARDSGGNRAVIHGASN
jgi:diguanylate cyclase (GGDEF)-like protein